MFTIGCVHISEVVHKKWCSQEDVFISQTLSTRTDVHKRMFNSERWSTVNGFPNMLITQRLSTGKCDHNNKWSHDQSDHIRSFHDTEKTTKALEAKLCRK